MVYHFLCEDSLDGIFTAVYNIFESGLGIKNCAVRTAYDGQGALLCEYIMVNTNLEKSLKVGNTIRSRFGQEFYETVASAAISDPGTKKLPMEKGNAIFQTIALALSPAGGKQVLHYIQEPCIQTVFELNRQTVREGHHHLGFLRFQELPEHILYAVIHPKNRILPILADHFSDRMPMERFIIHDVTHQQAAVHREESPYLIVSDQLLPPEFLNQTDTAHEDMIQNLWCTFFENIAIEQRRNKPLQQQNLPKRYWPDLAESRLLSKKGTVHSDM